MKSEMTAGEAAEILENMGKTAEWFAHGSVKSRALHFAASILRRVEAGELRKVVHGHWVPKTTPWPDCMKYCVCSNCGREEDSYETTPYCAGCGALMDGKDGAPND